MENILSSTEQFSKVLHDWVRVFMRHSGQDFKHFMNDFGLSFSQVSTIMRLHFSEQAEISDIARVLGITNAASSQLVDALVHMGYVLRMEDNADRRVKRISLTQSGHALAEKLVDTRRSWVEKFTSSLTAQQREEISNALQMLTEAARKIED
jgi:DNA-binding MarR family transcriptional regulator